MESLCKYIDACRFIIAALLSFLERKPKPVLNNDTFLLQALSTYSSVPQISTQLHFLKAQVLLASGEPVEIGLNLLQTSLLSSPVHSPNAWQVILQRSPLVPSCKVAQGQTHPNTPPFHPPFQKSLPHPLL